MTMACVFNPPVTGAEVHQPDGSYALEDKVA
jgi:L-ectoine synthase